MHSVLVKTQVPKPNLRIRIPSPRPDEEILKSPVETPVAPQPRLPIADWLKRCMRGL